MGYHSKAILTHYGLKAREIKRDGACCFRALADQLYGDQERGQEVRNKIVEHLRNNRSFYGSFAVLQEDDIYEDYKEKFANAEDKFTMYCDYMSLDTVWGGQTELTACANTFGVVVRCWEWTRFQDYVPDEIFHRLPSYMPTVHVLYNGRDHYDSVVPASTNQRGKTVINLPAYDLGSAGTYRRQRITINEPIKDGCVEQTSPLPPPPPQPQAATEEPEMVTTRSQAAVQRQSSIWTQRSLESAAALKHMVPGWMIARVQLAFPSLQLSDGELIIIAVEACRSPEKLVQIIQDLKAHRAGADTELQPLKRSPQPAKSTTSLTETKKPAGVRKARSKNASPSLKKALTPLVDSKA